MMRMKRFLPWFAVAGAAAALAACNSGSSSPTVNNCGSPKGVSQTVLVYPAPGATGVPDNITQVIVGSTSAIPSGWGLTIATQLFGTQNGNGVVPAPTPLPTPNQTPSFANPVYQSSTFSPAITTAGTAMGVYLNNLNSNCVPSVLVGSFTTE